MENKWSGDIEAVLDNLRENCVVMSKTHKESYFFYKQVVKYFRIPTILLSSIGSVSSVGLNELPSSKSHLGVDLWIGVDCKHTELN
jgi:hypothetical protein